MNREVFTIHSEAVARAIDLLKLGANVNLYRDMDNGNKIWRIQWGFGGTL